jgi:hypothetical protein
VTLQRIETGDTIGYDECDFEASVEIQGQQIKK